MNKATIPQPVATDRVIRVFISSTFRDMQRERDLLVKRVFPALRRICAKRFVTFTEVDLRWGITEEQAAEGKVLPLCLAEIERSRPYFIALLGERYGWIPDEIPADIIAAEPWLAEHVQGRKSVTELEILHGVLNDKAMRGRAFFYFRDPAYGIDPAKYPGLTGDERRELPERDIPWEIEELGLAEAARRTQERKDKLAALKQRIRDSKLPLVDPYADPEALAAIIEKQFADLIDDLYPEDRTPDPLMQERLMHEAHAKNKLFACIDRPAHMAALTTFSELADHGGKGFVVTGESGGGKTALLAAWARDWKMNNTEDFLFQHYFGATPDSSSPNGFLRRLLGEIKVRFGITDDIPSDPDKLREALPLWLAFIPRDVQTLLTLDGVNQLRGGESDRHLRFLPRQFPPHVTVLASALPGPALDALRERGWAEHDLPRATEAEVDAMVGEYFRIHGRHVDAEGRPIQTPLRRQLVTAAGCKNPLFLRTVLEELRQFGSFEQLPARVTQYLEATTPEELFLAVLRRWQEDFDGKEAKGPNVALTRRALTHLWAAREGLSEPEWLDLLGMDAASASETQPTPLHNPSFILHASPLPRAYWTPLFLALEPHLSQRAGLFAFGHDFLRQAVETAFAAEAQAQQAAHLAVADYFERHEAQQEMTARKLAEWPHQLHAAKAWERLEACLTDIPLFLAIYNARTKWELTGYWHPLRRNGRDMGRCYSTVYERWTALPANAADHYVPAQVGQFLSDNGLYTPAEALLRRALEASERVLGPEHPNTLGSVNNLAGLLYNKGDYAGAQPLYERALEGLLMLSQAIHRPHPKLEACARNYARCLEKLGRSPEQIRSTMAELGRRYGIDLGEVGGRTGNEPSPKLRVVLEEIMRDPSKINHIAARLYREDPALLRELVQFIQSQQDKATESQPQPTREEQPLALRQTALQLFREGKYAEAGTLLEQLLQAGFEISSTHHHLARLCLITDRFSEAREHVIQGWAARENAKAYLIARLLWFQLALDMLGEGRGGCPQPAVAAAEGTPRPTTTLILGRLKTTLQSDGAFMEWTMQPVLDHLRPKLSESDHALLTALVAALNDRAKLPDLDPFPAWRQALPQPLK